QWFNDHYDFFKDFSGSFVALLGLIVTATIAGFGFRSFGKFKREKLEERRIEVAIDALAIAYESVFVFQAIRSRWVRGEEQDDDDQGTFGRIEGTVAISLTSGQRSAYAILKRIRSHEDFFEKVYKLEPRFMAVFGADTDEIFSKLYSAKARVEAAAQGLYGAE